MEEEKDQRDCAALRDVVVDDAARERQRRGMSAFGGVLNLMTAFAAPRYLARATTIEPLPQAEILSLLDDFVEMMEGQVRGEKELKILDITRRMRVLLDGWRFSTVASPPIVETAREFMDAFGIFAPDEGWDAWEPPPEGEPGPGEASPA
ncbi:hypothetical protein WME77_23330 [Sorangium sp. So ce764]|uniref:hypothetical protein n=1 Tax=Sorangium sp. So ce764 TaxID=3133320 RepID=UPI003F6058AA